MLLGAMLRIGLAPAMMPTYSGLERQYLKKQFDLTVGRVSVRQSGKLCAIACLAFFAPDMPCLPRPQCRFILNPPANGLNNQQAIPGFVGVKLAKVAVIIGKADYPHGFPEFFAYLLALARVSVPH